MRYLLKKRYFGLLVFVILCLFLFFSAKGASSISSPVLKEYLSQYEMVLDTYEKELVLAKENKDTKRWNELVNEYSAVIKELTNTWKDLVYSIGQNDLLKGQPKVDALNKRALSILEKEVSN